MGLDMYLSRKKYIGANYEHRNVKGTIDITADGKKIPVDFSKVSYIEESVGYWRKANAIHKWFVDNCQDGIDDCRQAYVSKEKLEELLKLCKEVKEKAVIEKGKVNNGRAYTNGKWEDIIEDGDIIANAEEIEELLPTESGCFFGSTDYDQYYMYDIDNTIEILENVLKDEEELNKNGVYSEFYYQSSW